ncbi:DUF2793 domain-containing protein [Sphingosinicellaceae bacterium]|nr:DUF2793 domain-containing protein [Sphingosinicellaceae bacterium]
MSELTDRYALPLLQVAQAQKEVTHNEAVAGIDALLHLAVETSVLALPPVAPSPGQAWIVAAAATGIWAGHAGEVASFGSGGWRYTVPREGCVAWLRDVQRFAVRTGTGWRDDGWPSSGVRIGSRLALGEVPAVIAVPSGGTVLDAQARFVIIALTDALRAQGIVA